MASMTAACFPMNNPAATPCVTGAMIVLMERPAIGTPAFTKAKQYRSPSGSPSGEVTAGLQIQNHIDGGRAGHASEHGENR